MLEIEKAAREYIIAAGGELYLYDYGNIRMCCGQMNPGPSLRLGRPPAKMENEYRSVHIDGIAVYLPQGFELQPYLKVKLRSFWFFNDLYLEGWKLL